VVARLPRREFEKKMTRHTSLKTPFSLC
jgi:hypothetical protein